MHEFYELDEDVNYQYNFRNKNKTVDAEDGCIIEYMNSGESLISKKKRLVEIIKELNRLELIEVFNIFKENGCSFTENTNGIFINITNTEETIIDQVYTFIGYIKEKRKELNEHDDKMNVEKNIIGDFNKLNEENYDNYIFNKNFISQLQENKPVEILSDSDEEIIYQLDFSSDEDQDLENKMSLKKKKIKYTGTRAKIIRSYKESNGKENTGPKKKTPKEKEEED